MMTSLKILLENYGVDTVHTSTCLWYAAAAFSAAAFSAALAKDRAFDFPTAGPCAPLEYSPALTNLGDATHNSQDMFSFVVARRKTKQQTKLLTWT